MSDADEALNKMRRFTPGYGGGQIDFHLLGTGAVAEIEAKLRAWYGAAYALCVSNATDALRAIALALELRAAEFITTPLTWGGSIGEWLRLGNNVRFASLDATTLTINAASVRSLITRRTRAILAVDVFGNPADMKALRAIADEFGLCYVSDASPSLGARRCERPASCLADVWVVSFGTGKGVDGGDGAAILTNDVRLFERLVWETQHPMRHRLELGLSLDNEFASNARMNPWTAIWLAATFAEQMKQLLSRQRRLAQLLERAELSHLIVSALSAGDEVAPSFQRIVARWHDDVRRADLLTLFREEGVPAALVPLPLRPIFVQPSFVAQYRRRAAGVLDVSSLGVDLSDYFILQPVGSEWYGSTRP